MACLKYISWLLTFIYLIEGCSGQDSMVSVLDKLKQFEEDLLDNKMDILRTEKRVLDTIDVRETSLRAEFKKNIRDEVREAMAEILQGESLQDMVRSLVVSEMRHLQQGYHQMKRQLRHVSRSLRDFQDETTVFHESLLKNPDVWNASDVCVQEKHRLELELQKADDATASLKTDVKRMTTLKETCQSQLSKLLKNDSDSDSSSPSPPNVTSTPRTSVSTTTPSTTTPRGVEELSKILIALTWSSTPNQFRQINIHSNVLSVYPYHSMKRVITLAYIAKTRELLIGLHDPDLIATSALDTRDVKVLEVLVRTYGMAVDEDRDIVFMSTHKPQPSNSRMSTQRKDFTSMIDLSKYKYIPRQITLDTKRKKIYGCTGRKIFTVTYDGKGYTTLATGSSIFSVALDQTAGILFYGDARKLMKMNVSNNVSTKVTTLNTTPWNMRLYKGTIYYSSHISSVIGAVNITNTTVTYTSLNMKWGGTYCMCLIP